MICCVCKTDLDRKSGEVVVRTDVIVKGKKEHFCRDCWKSVERLRKFYPLPSVIEYLLGFEGG